MEATPAVTTPPEASASAAAAGSVDQPKKKKAPPANLVIPPKAKPLTKAERRALQEQQRAAKASASGGAAATTGGISSIGSAAATTTSTSGGAKEPAKVEKAAATSPADESGTDNPDTVAATLASNTTNTNSTIANNNSAVLSFVSHLPPPYPSPSVTFVTGAVLQPNIRQAVVSFADELPATTATSSGLSPAVIQLGYAYATGTIRGGNARCRAMLECFATLLVEHQDYAPSTSTSTSTAAVDDVRSLVDTHLLKPAFTFWTLHCRPHSVSMGNAYAYCKATLQNCPRDLSWSAVVTALLESMQAYRRERIEYALTAIAELACSKLLFSTSASTTMSTLGQKAGIHAKRHSGDSADLVLLTYGYSEAVCAVVIQAAQALLQENINDNDTARQPRKLRVICADSAPLLEGRHMLNRLLEFNSRSSNGDGAYVVLDCSYIHLAAVSYVLPTVHKVLLGAAALQSDGSVTGRVGMAVVAMMASSNNIPVLVCAETHKMSYRHGGGVQLESITHNEVLNVVVPSDKDMAMGGTTSSSGGKDDTDATTHVQRLDVMYDLTPATYVSGIVTELGIVPPSSIAVLLREMNQPLEWKQ